nr:uncharacterized protein BN887_05050 [Melanopsichium pennsylvanicum 4]
MPGTGPNGAHGGGGGNKGSSHSNHAFDFDQRSMELARDLSRSHPSFQPSLPHEDLQPLSESELMDAFSHLDFDESTRVALAQRLEVMQQHETNSAASVFGSGAGLDVSDASITDGGGGGGAKRTDPFASSGYNRDPNAFMFSPFSPTDSPIVGGKSDLPTSRSSSSSLHLATARLDDEAKGGSMETNTVGKAER